jgi:hypothetical protein
MQMEISMKANGFVIKLMVEANMSMEMELFTMVNGKKISNTV